MTNGPAHYILMCSCGQVIAQCRCDGPNKQKKIVERGCETCQAQDPKQLWKGGPIA